MNRYHIRIDGEQSTSSYTYQELVDMGLFDLGADGINGIEVKKVTKPNFTPLSSYCFPEKQDESGSYYVDEYGQIHRSSTTVNNNQRAYVDEYGQIVRPNTNRSSSSSSTSNSRNTTSSTSSNYSSSSNGWGTFWKIIGSIMIIVLVISIIAGTNGYGTPIAYGGYLALKAIWD